jgi:DNA-binding transcriptional MerR regulator
VEKAPNTFRTISEVAQDLDVPQHVLRFWESRFREINPMKRGGGRRYYRPDDVALLRGIRQLLYGEGYTIRGVQRIIREQGVKAVQTAGQPGPHHPPAELDEITEEAPAAQEADRRGLLRLLPTLLGNREQQPEFEAPDIQPESPDSRGSRVVVPPVPGTSGIPREDLRRLQAALHELAECRRLLDAALHDKV